MRSENSLNINYTVINAYAFHNLCENTHLAINVFISGVIIRQLIKLPFISVFIL